MPADDQLAERSGVDDGVVLAYPAARPVPGGQALGPRARLRSGTVLYEGSQIGSDFETGHHVVVREGSLIGDGVSIWSNTLVDYGCRIGHRVKIHCNCYIAQFTEIEDDAFLAPGVTLANDIYPGSPESAEHMAGPFIGRGAQIGVNVTILPLVSIGAGALIGAGAVVTKDIPAGAVAYGCPAAVSGRREDRMLGADHIARARAVRERTTGL